MKKLLIIESIHNDGIELLKQNKSFEFEIVDKTDEEFLKNKIKNFDAVSVRTSRLSKEILETATNLKIISRHGVGYDNIDLLEIKKKNITLAITATANAQAVAEHVLFMLFNIAKRNNMYDDTVKSGKFNDRTKLPKTIELWSKNILIAGFGRIGKCLLKKCKGLEMNIYVYDPFVKEEEIKNEGGIKVDDLSSSLNIMDAISIHMPLNDKTRHLINYDMIKKMKKNCILINAARGGIINESDLNKALNENLIFGAGLDVFEKEPPSQDNPLLKNNKAFLSPHSAVFTEECLSRMGIETIQNVIDFFENKLDNSKIVKI
tara:strand:- start:5985 stop:6941 length:957 start_codon:yes stop_codon:yes gene_type:complete